MKGIAKSLLCWNPEAGRVFEKQKKIEKKWTNNIVLQYEHEFTNERRCLYDE
jgi:hypothetical protein